MVKAADIPDETFLSIVREFNDGHRWAQIWDMEERLPDFPEKVIRAKAAGLMRRGLIGGCSCGCRGDYAVPESDLFY